MVLCRYPTSVERNRAPRRGHRTGGDDDGSTRRAVPYIGRGPRLLGRPATPSTGGNQCAVPSTGGGEEEWYDALKRFRCSLPDRNGIEDG